MIKKLFLIFSILCLTFSLSLISYAESFEDIFQDYQNNFNQYLDEENSYLNPPMLLSAAEVNPADVSTYPKGLTLEEFNSLYYCANSPLYSDLIQTFAADTPLNPHILFLRAIFELPFVSNEKGGNCDSKFVWWDNYSQSYFIVEYNSSIVDIYYTDLQYNNSDLYTGYIWFKFYNPTNLVGSAQNVLQGVFITSMSNYLNQSYYGQDENGNNLYPMYIYQLYEPTMYNSTNEISLVDVYGDVYAGTGVPSNTTRKVSNYWICGRAFFSTGYYRDIDRYNFIRPPSDRWFISMGTIMYNNNNTFVEPYNANGSSYIKGRSGEYIGSYNWGSYNLRDDYEQFSVPATKFWDFGRFLGQTIMPEESPYGIFSGIIIPTIDGLNYFVNYYLPNAMFEFSQNLNQYIANFNAIYNPFISGTNASMYVFRFLISMLYIMVVLRLLVSIGEMRE